MTAARFGTASASSRQTRGVNHKALLKLVTDYLDALPCWYAKLAGGAYQKPGLPDLVAAMPALVPIDGVPCCRARFVAIEIKTGAATLTAKQERERQAITAACGHYFLVHTIDELEQCLLDAGLLESPRLLVRQTAQNRAVAPATR